jgi:hypothetical protein
MALLGDTVELDGSLERLRLLRRRCRDFAGAAALLGGGGITLVALGRADLGAAALIAAAAGLGFSGLATSERANLLTRLVASDLGRGIPEVSAFAHTLTTPRRRRRLARGLELAVGAGRPGLHDFTHIRPDRAHPVRPQIADLAAAFRDPSWRVSPASAALCRRLLCEAAVSPLYNPALPEHELVHALEAIASGFER